MTKRIPNPGERVWFVSSDNNPRKPLDNFLLRPRIVAASDLEGIVIGSRIAHSEYLLEEEVAAIHAFWKETYEKPQE